MLVRILPGRTLSWMEGIPVDRLFASTEYLVAYSIFFFFLCMSDDGGVGSPSTDIVVRTVEIDITVHLYILVFI